MLFTLREQFLDTFFFETGLSQTEVPRRLSIVRLLMVLSSVCFFLIAKINQIPETCISQISGILSYFPVFTPSFWKD